MHLDLSGFAICCVLRACTRKKAADKAEFLLTRSAASINRPNNGRAVSVRFRDDRRVGYFAPRTKQIYPVMRLTSAALSCIPIHIGNVLAVSFFAAWRAMASGAERL